MTISNKGFLGKSLCREKMKDLRYASLTSIVPTGQREHAAEKHLSQNIWLQSTACNPQVFRETKKSILLQPRHCHLTKTQHASRSCQARSSMSTVASCTVAHSCSALGPVSTYPANVCPFNILQQLASHTNSKGSHNDIEYIDSDDGSAWLEWRECHLIDCTPPIIPEKTAYPSCYCSSAMCNTIHKMA